MKYKLILIFITFLASCDSNLSEKEDTYHPDPEARSRIISAEEINKKIAEGNDISYKDATIVGDIDFLKSNEYNLEIPNYIKHYINSSVFFYNCTFKGKLTARKAEEKLNRISNFNKNVVFLNCTFQDTVNFNSADFKGLVNFSESLFYGFTDFTSCGFYNKKNYFNSAYFYNKSRFNMMKVFGEINFFKTTFEDHTLFQLTKFNEAVHFGASKFFKDVDFTTTKFNDDAFFNYADFNKTCLFNNSVFKGRTEFIKCKFNFISEFKDCLFYGKTLYNKSEVIGVFTFENSHFLISEPKEMIFDIKIGTDFIFPDKSKFELNL